MVCPLPGKPHWWGDLPQAMDDMPYRSDIGYTALIIVGSFVNDKGPVKNESIVQ